MSKRIVIVGCGGFAREVLQIIRDLNATGADWEFAGWLDDDETKHHTTVAGYDVLGPTEWLSANPTVAAVIGIGDPSVIAKIAGRLDAMEIKQPALIHPRAWLGEDVRVGNGAILCAGTALTVDVTVGRNAILNLNATVGHDAIVGDYVVINPLTAISGGVRLGDGCLIGTGSTILQELSVGEWSIVGGGAVVVKDLPANVTAVGSPAKPIKERSPGWHL